MKLQDLRWTLLAAALCTFSIPAAMAGEHPEHPEDKKAESTVSLEDVAVHIEQWVAAQKDGKYVIEDTHAKTTLTLALDKIHRERLSPIGDDTYFVCADFKTEAGKVYDLDFFVKGTAKTNLEVVADQTSVHKESGEARYTWQEKDGVWSKKEDGGKEHPKGEHPEKKKGAEHPTEHPSEHPSEHPGK